MNPMLLIENYVDDVVRLLPRRQRADVAFELRSLLTEELEGRALDTGRDADAALALELLSSFGRPRDVADRYRPAGFAIISPADAPRFARVALGGVAVQWALTLAATFVQPTPGVEPLSLLGTWWLSWGLGSFWWPGILVTLSLVAAWVGARTERDGQWRPRTSTLDRDSVSRPVYILYIALGVVGASIVSTLPQLAVWAPWLPQPFVDALALDDGFVATRAPWALVLWLASLVVAVLVLVAGRRSAVTRNIALVVDVAWLALLIWWVVAGPILAGSSADELTKLILLILAVVIAVDLVVAVRKRIVTKPAPAL